MPTKRTDKPATIYAIWDTQEGCWWVARTAHMGLKTSWTTEGTARRAFNDRCSQFGHMRLDDQNRYLLVPLYGAIVAGAELRVVFGEPLKAAA